MKKDQDDRFHQDDEAPLKRPFTIKKQPTVSYDIDDKFKPGNGSPDQVHTVPELIACLENNKDVAIEAKVYCYDKRSGKLHTRRLSRDGFLEAFRANSRLRRIPKGLRESFDGFDMDCDSVGSTKAGTLGSDFVPLLGGPFNKQQYYYDYLRGHALAFHAINHDPIARAYLNIVQEFVLGRGFRVDCKDEKAMAVWEAFAEANDLQKLMRYILKELRAYGEVMIWKLPDKRTKVGYNLLPGQEVPVGLLPRVTLIDPSVIWEIVTYPEDITRVLFYQWVAPTQYQTYTGQDKGQPVSGTKFIFQQIPADQVIHEKVNVVSNEKRGRSDFFPVFGWMKRLRDTVGYELAKQQKNAAWSIDTAVEGSQTDIDAYIAAMDNEGSIPNAGSEFVHTAKVTRQYLANSSPQSPTDAFEWNLSMICAGLGVPVSYMNTHLSGGSTRGSALVATEPVTKKWEAMQIELEGIVKKLAKYCFEEMGIDPNTEIEVTFPDLMQQDRSAKMKDLALAVQEKWISNERAATIAAKELGITEFDYDMEKKDIEQEQEEEMQSMTANAPLTHPGLVFPAPQAPAPAPSAQPEATPEQDPGKAKPSAVTSDQKRKLSLTHGF